MQVDKQPARQAAANENEQDDNNDDEDQEMETAASKRRKSKGKASSRSQPQEAEPEQEDGANEEGAPQEEEQEEQQEGLYDPDQREKPCSCVERVCLTRPILPSSRRETQDQERVQRSYLKLERCVTNAATSCRIQV